MACWWEISRPIRFSGGYGIVAMWQSTSANNAPELIATNAFPGNALCAQTFNGTTRGVYVDRLHRTQKT